MSTVAVVAHAGKTFGGGLVELRRLLEKPRGSPTRSGTRCRRAARRPKQVKRALEEGAELALRVGRRRNGAALRRRAADGRRDGDPPAGTANLFASNLGIPQDIEKAVRIGLDGARRKLDVGRMNGERFAVMAGAGFDAQMIRDADGGLKDASARLAYVWTGTKQLGRKPFEAKIKVDGATWFNGQASSVLVGNVGKLFGGVEAFEDARPDDGKLELGVVTADGLLEWTRTIARTAVGSSSASPFVQVTKASSVQVKFDRKMLYELDGGDREPGQGARGRGRAGGDHRLCPRTEAP